MKSDSERNAPSGVAVQRVVIQHNSSTKPMARLKHALWMVTHTKEIEENRQWNIRTRRRKWSQLGAV
jgi:hypothetical protein